MGNEGVLNLWFMTRGKLLIDRRHVAVSQSFLTQLSFTCDRVVSYYILALVKEETHDKTIDKSVMSSNFMINSNK